MAADTETTMSPAEVQLILEQLAAWKMVAWQARAERDAENIRAATLAAERDSLNAARIAYASEFDPDAEGLPSVGSIHENIRKLKAERDALAADRDSAMEIARALARLRDGLDNSSSSAEEMASRLAHKANELVARAEARKPEGGAP